MGWNFLKKFIAFLVLFIFGVLVVEGKSIPSCVDQIEALKAKYAGNYPILIQKIKTFLDQTDFSNKETCKGKCLQVIANRYQDLNIWDSAFIYTCQALRFRSKICDTAGMISSLFILSDLYTEKLEFDLAQKVYDYILNIQPFTEDSRFACSKSGDIQFGNIGDYEMSKYYYEQFYNSNFQLVDSLYIHYSRLLMVRAERVSEQFDSTKCLGIIDIALKYFDQIKLESENTKIYISENRFKIIIEAYFNLLSIKSLQSRHREVLKWGKFIIHKYKDKFQNLNDLALIYFELAKAEYELNHVESSLNYCKLAIQTLMEHNGKFRCQFYTKLANIYVRLGYYGSAHNALQEAANAILPFGDSLCIEEVPQYSLIGYCDNIPDIFDYESALGLHYFNLFKQFNRKEDLVRSMRYYQLSDSLIDAYRERITLERTQYKKRNEAYSSYFNAFKVAQALKDWKLAFYFMEKANALLLMDEIKTKDWTLTLPDSVQVELKRIEFDKKRNDSLYSLSTDICDKIEIQDIRIKLAKYSKNYKDRIMNTFPFTDKIRRKLVSLESIQKELKPDEVILYYFSNDSLQNQIVISNSSFEIFEKPLDSSLINTLEDYVSYCRLNSKLMDANQKMYWQYLQDQISEFLIPNIPNTCTHLIIIPDRLISQVPFESIKTRIFNSSHLDYLIKHCSIEYQWSISLKFLLENRKSNYNNGGLLVFAPGFIQSASLLKQDAALTRDNYFEALPFSIAESKNIFSYFYGKEFIGEYATRSNFFKKIANNYSIVHLATHASSNLDNQDSSYFVLTGNDASMFDKILIRDIQSQNIQAQLIVLSACETALGHRTYSEGLLSLARSFTMTGIGSSVSSLWKVNDGSTAILMKYFYKELSTGKSKAKSLRLAKMELMEQNPECANPYYWAPFVLYGNNTPIEVSWWKSIFSI